MFSCWHRSGSVDGNPGFGVGLVAITTLPSGTKKRSSLRVGRRISIAGKMRFRKVCGHAPVPCCGYFNSSSNTSSNWLPSSLWPVARHVGLRLRIIYCAQPQNATAAYAALADQTTRKSSSSEDPPVVSPCRRVNMSNTTLYVHSVSTRRLRRSTTISDHRIIDAPQLVKSSR